MCTAESAAVQLLFETQNRLAGGREKKTEYEQKPLFRLPARPPCQFLCPTVTWSNSAGLHDWLMPLAKPYIITLFTLHTHLVYVTVQKNNPEATDVGRLLIFRLFTRLVAVLSALVLD